MNLLYSQKWAMVKLEEPETGGAVVEMAVLGCNADMENVDRRVAALQKLRDEGKPFEGTFQRKYYGWKILDAWVKSPAEAIERRGTVVVVEDDAAKRYHDACLAAFREIDTPQGPGFRHFFPKHGELSTIFEDIQGKRLDVVDVFGGSVPSAEFSSRIAVPGYYGDKFYDVYSDVHGLLRLYPPSLRHTTSAEAVVRYVTTYVNKEGLRTLTAAAQGRNTFDTRKEAEAHLDVMLANNGESKLRQLFGDDPRFEVRECLCWPGHFDPKGCYFDV